MRLWKSQSAARSIGAVVLLLTTVTACDYFNRASGPNFQYLIHPDPDGAIVYFYREARPEAPQSPDWIYAFDQIIRLDPGGYTFQIIPSGRYLISLKSKHNGHDVWFDFNRGQTAFLKWTSVSKGDGYESNLMLIDESQALKELPDCRLMQLDPGGRP